MMKLACYLILVVVAILTISAIVSAIYMALQIVACAVVACAVVWGIAKLVNCFTPTDKPPA